MVRSIVDDLHRAARGLRRDPLLVLIATITLATCIAATTTIFSVVNSVLIRPLVYPASERIDWISERSGPAHEDLGVAPDYYAIREQNRIFEETGAVNSISANWTGVERPERLDAASASASFFRVMGTRPLMGRYFDPGEEGPKRPAVVIVSYAFWRNRLGMDPDIVGKSIGIDRLQHTVIGVMPQGFDIPHGAQVWVPVPWDKVFQGFPLSSKSALSLTSIVARRKAGVSALQAETEMNRLTFAIRNEYKVFHATGFRSDLTISAIPLQRHLTGDVRPALLVLTGAVGLVLLIACVNLANLLLARAGSRRTRTGGPFGAGIEPCPADPSDVSGKPGVGCARRHRRHRNRLDRGSPAQRGQAFNPDALSGDYDRLASGRVYDRGDHRNQLGIRDCSRRVCGRNPDPGGAEGSSVGAYRNSAAQGASGG